MSNRGRIYIYIYIYMKGTAHPFQNIKIDLLLNCHVYNLTTRRCPSNTSFLSSSQPCRLIIKTVPYEVYRRLSHPLFGDCLLSRGFSSQRCPDFRPRRTSKRMDHTEDDPYRVQVVFHYVRANGANYSLIAMNAGRPDFAVGSFPLIVFLYGPKCGPY